MSVLMQGPVSAPRLLGRWTLELSDPAVPHSRQPYHAATGVARMPSPDLVRLLESVASHTRRSVAELVHRCGDAGARPDTAGLVVGSVIDPTRIANPHVQAHASEGRLFRMVVEDALRVLGIASTILVERELMGRGATELGIAEAALKRRLVDFGRGLEGSWQRDDKLAALAGWLGLG